MSEALVLNERSNLLQDQAQKLQTEAQESIFFSPGKHIDQKPLSHHLNFLPGTEADSCKKFSFKLTQIGGAQSNQNDKTENQVKKQQQSRKDIVELHTKLYDIQFFLQSQRVDLIKEILAKNADGSIRENNQLIRETLDSFFEVVLGMNQEAMYLSNNIQSQVPTVLKSSPIKKQTDKENSPQKNSPQKGMQSPQKDCIQLKMFSSPMASLRNLQQTPESACNLQCNENNSSDEKKLQESSPDSQQSGKHLPKSPVRRMKQLEEQQNTYDAEDVETTYLKSPDKQQDVQQEQAKSLLPQVDECKPVTHEQELIDVSKLLEIDSNVINYGQFISGKILGSTLLLTNISSEEQYVSLSISQQAAFDCDAIFGQYNRDELPFQYKDGTLINNAENDFACWFIENPLNKELLKNVTMKLAAKSQQEFIIVVKAPKNKIQARIVSFISIELNKELKGIEKMTEKNADKSKKEFAKVESTCISRLDVLLLGYLDNPRIRCMRQLFHKASNCEIIQLAVKKVAGIQKFKLPFKNMSEYLDADIEFAFIKTQATQLKRISEFMEPIECLQFYCQPNQLKINAEQLQILTVQVKVNTDVLFNPAKVDQKTMNRPQNKLLVARLKNSQVLFSFFVSITLVADSNTE